jgi:hypothetical protein
MSKEGIVPRRQLQSAVYESTRSDLYDRDDLDDEDEAGQLNESRPDLSIGQEDPSDVYTQSSYVVPPSSGNAYPTETAASQSYPCVGTKSHYHNSHIHTVAYSTGVTVTAVPESAVGPPESAGQYSPGIHPAHTETKPALQTSSPVQWPPPPSPASTEDVTCCSTKRWIAIAISVVSVIGASVGATAKRGSKLVLDIPNLPPLRPLRSFALLHRSPRQLVHSPLQVMYCIAEMPQT